MSLPKVKNQGKFETKLVALNYHLSTTDKFTCNKFVIFLDSDMLKLQVYLKILVMSNKL